MPANAAAPARAFFVLLKLFHFSFKLLFFFDPEPVLPFFPLWAAVKRFLASDIDGPPLGMGPIGLDCVLALERILNLLYLDFISLASLSISLLNFNEYFFFFFFSFDLYLLLVLAGSFFFLLSFLDLGLFFEPLVFGARRFPFVFIGFPFVFIGFPGFIYYIIYNKNI